LPAGLLAIPQQAEVVEAERTEKAKLAAKYEALKK
jgi:hypothetical protein